MDMLFIGFSLGILFMGICDLYRKNSTIVVNKNADKGKIPPPSHQFSAKIKERLIMFSVNDTFTIVNIDFANKLYIISINGKLYTISFSSIIPRK